jgi:hypothetical protein
VPPVIGKLDLKDAGSKSFDDGADLATEQAPLGQIRGESYDIEQSDVVLGRGHEHSYST